MGISFEVDEEKAHCSGDAEDATRVVRHDSAV
jgi:hypothetical protein